ncbi:DNA replication regulator SLD3-domain-containing protein [Pestalotiopsis sp. NC0098]|nr:DNA replication regulator SLD3-domain-containing protein [Pestalotiopsis sp. NC0098]
MSLTARASDASRRISEAKVVPSDLSRHDGSSPSSSSSGSRKRSLDAYGMEDLLRPSIVVKPHPSRLSTKPRSLQPLMLLPREHLALSCLDLAAPCGEFEHARQYESTIKILDLESRLGNRPVVLIARMETNKTAYVLERQDGGLYSLCQLGNWVDLERLSAQATVAYSKLLKPRSKPVDISNHEASTTPQLHHENKKRRLAMEAIQSLVKRPARSMSVSLPPQQPYTHRGPSVSREESAAQTTMSSGSSKSQIEKDGVDQSNDAPTSSAPLDGPSVQTAQDIFENIRLQYFEALYHSMGSLAYFAKGPLSRARAAFRPDSDSNLDMDELIDFLKSLILTTIQVDKKFRESVPGILARMKTHIADSEDDQVSKAKKRKSKKMKLGKDVLYPNEDEHVRRWWQVRKPQQKDDDSSPKEVPQETKLQISRLRSRETQLQMILILEILALEPLRKIAKEDSQLGSCGETETIKDSLPKKRNKHNFPMLLDVHADRLSIWQSISLDEIKVMDESQSGGPNAAQNSASNTDPLKDFCIEIIVPFFSARLPEQCDSLNRKLGGPLMPSPPKPKPKKAEDAAVPKAKPGTTTKRPAASKTVRTLDRVLSKESERNRRSMSRGPGSMIALMRSATTPVPMLKREASDTVTMASLPARRDSQDMSASRSQASNSSVAAVRRVNPEDKAKKEADINAELKAAISSLRKPNREVVGKAMAEADERRATTSLSQLRKSKKPTEHGGIHNIIKATPAGPRFRNAFARDSHAHPTSAKIHESVEVEQIVSSSRQIPSTVTKKRSSEAAFLVEESSPALPPPMARPDLIGATPLRRPAIKRNFLSAPESDEGLVLASSPIAARRHPPAPSSYLKHRDSGIGMPSSPGDRLAETPVKRPRLGKTGSLEGYVTVTPVKNRGTDVDIEAPDVPKLHLEKDQKQTRTMSLYERLGWDDDFDDLI